MRSPISCFATVPFGLCLSTPKTQACCTWRRQGNGEVYSIAAKLGDLGEIWGHRTWEIWGHRTWEIWGHRTQFRAKPAELAQAPQCCDGRPTSWKRTET